MANESHAILYARARCLCSAYENKLCILGFYSPSPKVRVPLWVSEQICPSCEVQKKAEREMFEADIEMDTKILRIQREGYPSNPSTNDKFGQGG